MAGYDSPFADEASRYTTLRDRLAVCFRHRRLMALCFSGVLAGAALYAWLWAARYYESSMQILVLPDSSDTGSPPVNGSPQQAEQAVTTQQINSEVALLQGTDLLGQVADTCGLSNRHRISEFLIPFAPKARAQARRAQTVLWLERSLHVDAEKQANVIDVSFGATGSPETPVCVLRSLSSLYLDKRMRLRRPPELLDFFTQQTEKYRASLTDAENALTAFGANQGAVAPDVQRNLLTQRLVDAQSALLEAQQALAENRQRLRSLTEQLAVTPSRILTQEHNEAAGALLQQLEPQLLAAKLRREQLAMKFAPDYPLVQEADREVADAKAAIEEAIRMPLRDQTTDENPTYTQLQEDAAKTRADLAEREMAISSLTKSIQQLKTQAAQIDQEAIQFQGLLRDEKANEENYLLYLAKQEQERSAEAMNERRLANVAIAVPPSEPVLPAYSPWKVLAIGLALAVILSLVSAFIGEHMDATFRTPKDVADTLDVPVLAFMPKQVA